MYELIDEFGLFVVIYMFDVLEEVDDLLLSMFELKVK